MGSFMSARVLNVNFKNYNFTIQYSYILVIEFDPGMSFRTSTKKRFTVITNAILFITIAALA